MDLKDLRITLETLKEFGVTHLKTIEIEVSLASPIVAQKEIHKPQATISKKNKKEGIASEPLIKEEIKEDNIIKHSIEQLTHLMKLSDVELVDSLFPDHTQEEEAS